MINIKSYCTVHRSNIMQNALNPPVVSTAVNCVRRMKSATMTKDSVYPVSHQAFEITITMTTSVLVSRHLDIKHTCIHLVQVTPL